MELIENKRPTLEQVYQLLRIDGSKILNVYLFGSRVYGLFNEESDWDLIIVCTNDYEYQHPTPDKHFMSVDENFKLVEGREYLRVMISCGNINVGIYKEQVWRSLLREHSIWVLFCCSLPPEFKWKQTIDFLAEHQLKMRKLRSAVLAESGRSWHKARKKLKDKELMKCKKLIVYTMRHLNWGIQLASNLKIVELGWGNHLWKDLKDETCMDWKYYEKKYKPLYLELKEKFSHVAPHKELQMPLSINGTSKTQALKQLKEYITMFGWQSLCRDFSVICTPVPDDKNLMRFDLDQWETPTEYDMLRLCNGLVVDLSNNLQPVCLPTPVYYSHTKQPYVSEFDWNTAIVFEKLDGIMISMYSRNDSWTISTPCERKDIKEEFWKIWKEKRYCFPTNKSMTYIFEMVSKKFRHFVKYSQDDIFLTSCSIFTKDSWKEIDYQTIAKQHGWKCEPIATIPEITDNKHQDILTTLRSLVDPSQARGFIVQDSKLNRIVYNSPSFSTLQLVLKFYEDNKFAYIDPKRSYLDLEQLLWDLIRFSYSNHRDTVIEFLSNDQLNMKIIKQFYQKLRREYINCCNIIQEAYNKFQDLEKHKFAKQIQALPFKNILFEMKKQGINTCSKLFATFPQSTYKNVIKSMGK